VVGAPRCGTTALHDLLAQHPDVFMTREKEPHFFSKDLNRRYEEFQGHTIATLHPDLESYLRLFADAGDARIRGESSVYYIYSDVAAREIAAFAPDARIVVLVRDPVELLRSMHAKLLVMGDEDRDFEAAIDLEEARRAGRELPANVRVPWVLYYSDFARLAPRIEPYRELFGPERVRVVLLDDFRARTEREFHGILDFLEIERIPLPDTTALNANRIPRSRLVARVLKRRRPDGRYRYGGRLASLLTRLNERPASRRPLDPGLRARLVARFRPDVEALSELLGRDLVELWGYGSRRP